MANRKATGKKAKHAGELVQRIRAGILGAMDAVEQRGRKISDILADEFEANPLKFMDMASKHIPKELIAEVEETVRHYVVNAEPEMSTDEWIQKSSGDHNRDRKPH